MRAQALPTATGPGGYISIGGLASAYEADYGKRWLGGTGIYADANLTWRLGVEAEARSLHYHQEAGVRERTYLIGPRVSLRSGNIRPYVKALVGAGKFDFPYGYAKGTYLVVAPGGGVDCNLGSRLSVRLLDFEYQDWPQFTYGQLHPYGVSMGVSFRLFRGSEFPR